MIEITINENGSVFPQRISLGNKLENLDEKLHFIIPDALSDKHKYLICCHDKGNHIVLPLSADNEISITSSLTHKNGNWYLYLTFTDNELDTSSGTLDLSAVNDHIKICDGIIGEVQYNKIDKTEIDKFNEDANLKIFYNEILAAVDAKTKQLSEEIDNLKDNGTSGNISEEDIQNAVNNYLNENPVEGGTTDYTTLENKPSINGVELNGNKTSADLGIGNPTDEQVASAVSTWLDENPEATTTVADKSINPDKTTWLSQVFHNIFNASTSEAGKGFYTSNVNTTSNATCSVSDFIPVKENTEYRFVNITNVRYVDSNKAYVGMQISNSIMDRVETTPSGACYVKIQYVTEKESTVQLHEYAGDSFEYDTYMNLYDIRVSSDSYTVALVELVKQEIEKGNVDIGELIPLENIPFEKMNGFEEWHWNIVNPNEVVMGSINNGDGSDRVIGDTATAYYRRTGYIPVIPNEIIYSLSGSWYGYDAEKNFVSKLDETGGIITIPENVYFIRSTATSTSGVPIFNAFRRGYGQNALIYSSTLEHSIYFPMFKDEIAKDGFKSYLGIYPWADKKFCFIGDSFTAPGVWNSNMVGNLKGVYVGSEAVSGGAFSKYDGVPKTAYEQAQNFVANGWNPDVILITLGTNDANNQKTLGEIVHSTSISDFDLTTFTGGMQACLNYLQNNYPNAIIYIGFTPMGGLTSNNTEYIERMKEVALAYGIEYIETRTCGVTTLSEVYADCYKAGTSGGHPTGTGQIKIGEYMTRLLMNKA